MINNDSYLTIQQLKERGWSRRLVAQFLGPADLTGKPTPTKTGRPRQYFCSRKVLRIEQGHPEFASESARSREFALRSARAASEKHECLVDVVAQIALPRLDLAFDALLSLVAEARQLKDSEMPLEQLALEYLLDTMVSLEAALAIYAWHSGVCEARKDLGDRLLNHIVQTYPLLSDAATKSRKGVHQKVK